MCTSECILKLRERYMTLREAGYSNAKIGEICGVSVQTVYNHLSEIADKHGIPRHLLLDENYEAGRSPWSLSYTANKPNSSITTVAVDATIGTSRFDNLTQLSVDELSNEENRINEIMLERKLRSTELHAELNQITKEVAEHEVDLLKLNDAIAKRKDALDLIYENIGKLKEQERELLYAIDAAETAARRIGESINSCKIESEAHCVQLEEINRLDQDDEKYLEEVLRLKIERSTIHIFVYSDGNIEAQNSDAPLDDSGYEELVKSLLNRRECQELRRREFPTLARLLTITSHIEHYDVLFDSKDLKTAFHAILES